MSQNGKEEDFRMKSLISEKIDPTSPSLENDAAWLRKESNKVVHKKLEQASLPAMLGIARVLVLSV
jgi:hypothetical protein